MTPALALRAVARRKWLKANPPQPKAFTLRIDIDTVLGWKSNADTEAYFRKKMPGIDFSKGIFATREDFETGDTIVAWYPAGNDALAERFVAPVKWITRIEAENLYPR